MVRPGLIIAATILLLVSAYSKPTDIGSFDKTYGYPPLSNAGEAGPYIAPSYQRVADATYPLSRLIFFNTNRDPDDPVNPVLDEFLRFILSREVQQLILDQAIYTPLRSSQANASLALLEQGGKP